ncbi:MAG: CotH kinase family protein [Acholeplasmataceae bacterium]
MKKLCISIIGLFLSMPLFFVAFFGSIVHVDAQSIDIQNPSEFVYINEIVSSNQMLYPDRNQAFHDWIELYNPNNTRVNLSGFYLSDDLLNQTKYEIPSQVTIEPYGFLIIYASGLDQVIGDEIHTNFAINQLGEPLILSHPNLDVADYVAPIYIPSNMSYGRQPDGSDTWVFFSQLEVTPNQSNNQAERTIIPAELNPDVSHTGGFYDASFHLSLLPKEGTQVYYTLDGSDPTPNDYLYEDPLFIEPEVIVATGAELRIQRTEFMTEIPVPTQPISMIRSGSSQWRSPQEDIFKATTLKARAFGEDGLMSDVITHTYFVDPLASERYSFPVMSITTDIDHLFSFETGINVPGTHYDPTIPESQSNRTGNFYQSGELWERPVYVEYFETDGTRVIAQNAGLRIHGGLSRKYPIKSYRLYARSEYDPQNSFNYPFFADKDIDEFKRLILRGGGQTFQYTMMGEAAAQSLLKPLTLDFQYNQPMILFINGEYFGIRNIRDRIDDWHLAIHYGGERENFTILTGNGYPEDGSLEGQSHYQNLYRTITRNDMQSDYYYDYVKTQMDIENFIDYYIVQLYYANIDWPQNNVNYWRYNTSQYDPNAPYGLDGRWRWIVFDVDAGFGASWGGVEPTYNSFERLTGVDWKTGNMFQSLMKNETFRNQFINRFADLINTHLSGHVAQEVVESYRNIYDGEMQEHIKRWGYPGSYNLWQGYVNRMSTFASERPNYLRTQMLDYFDLESMKELRVYTNLNQGTVIVNQLTLSEDFIRFNHFSGMYFEGVPVKLKAMANPGYRFIGWYNQFNQIVSLNEVYEAPMDTHLSIIARFEVGSPIIPDDQGPMINESVILYTLLFILASVAVVGFLAETHRRKANTFKG